MKSRKFSKTSEKDEILLYFISILTLVQIFYLVMHKKYSFILIFFLVGIVLSFFIKNQTTVLVINIIFINILLNVKRHEGLEGSMPPMLKKTSTTPTTTATTTTTATPTATPSGEAKKKISSKVSKTASSVSDPTTLNPMKKQTENFESVGGSDHGQINQVGKHIEALSNLMDKFNGMANNLNLFGK